MIILYKKIGTFEGKSAFSTWVYRITVNAFLMHKRRQRSEQLYFLGDESFESYLDPMVLHKEAEQFSYYHILSNEFQTKLTRALSELPRGYRDVFLMHSKQDIAIKDISARLGLSVSAVKSRHHRARQFLKDRLKHNYSN
jgi:RNA polymerase sigma-70 factor (ECF subfamily)